MACEKQITEVSECHNKTKTDKYEKSSSVREAELLKLRFSRRTRNPSSVAKRRRRPFRCRCIRSLFVVSTNIGFICAANA